MCRRFLAAALPNAVYGRSCVNWPGSLDPQGFGRVRHKGKNYRAHRLAYVAIWGYTGTDAVRHTCGNHACVNYLHLIGGDYNPATDIWGDHCTARGCWGEAKANGLCGTHYSRQRAGKRLDAPVQFHPRGGGIEASLLRAVRNTVSGCLELPWRKGGYRPIVKSNGRTEIAARAAYELWVGPIPQGLSVLHACDNGCCIEPTHLYPGTAARNYADMVERGRDRKARGEESGTAVLNEAAVLDIRARWERGESQPHIAEMYAVGTHTVRAVINGWTWKHVTGGTPAVRQSDCPEPVEAVPDDDWMPEGPRSAAVPCSVAGCGRPVVSQGLCPAHRQRLRTHGDVQADKPVGFMRSSRYDVVAVLARASRSEDPAPYGLPVPCLLFPSKSHRRPLAKGSDGRARAVYAIAYEEWVGPIPDGHYVLHRCDVPTCIERTHLYTGTQGQNMADKIERGRDNPAKGEAHFRSKLDADKVREIRRRRTDGDTMAAIARDLGVAHGTVKAVVDGRTWVHVT